MFVAVITVATCQFPVSSNAGDNLRWIARQMRSAAARGASVAHFPEGALSGYAGTDFADFDGFNWDDLKHASEDVLSLARELGIWVVFGSAHRLSDGNKPHNSAYVVDNRGEIIDRYDKRFCSGDPKGRSGDLAHFSPGDHVCIWEINEVRCAALICHDYRYPELYRDYKRQGVELVFHSFHAGNASPQRVAAIGISIGSELMSSNPAATFTYPGITMPASMTATAAASHVWISCSNSSARESLWPAFLVRADGLTVGRLRRNVPGILISDVDTNADIYDSTSAWRERAIGGVLHSGTVVSDPRSDNRRSL